MIYVRSSENNVDQEIKLIEGKRKTDREDQESGFTKVVIDDFEFWCFEVVLKIFVKKLSVMVCCAIFLNSISQSD